MLTQRVSQLTMSTISIVLASRSPRRRELLQQHGYDFQVVPPDDSAECGVCSGETPAELVARLARQKAENVAARTASGIVLGCDTVAVCQGQVLGKPVHREHAQQMLRTLRGRVHQVFSGLCLWKRPEDETLIEVDVTRLRMDDISDSAISDYLDTDAWEGKAGAFGYQDRLGWVHIEEGSESNVVGLPMERLANMLKQWGGFEART